jgi:hypothetical protein
MRRHSIQRLLTVPLWASAFVLTGLIIMQFSRRHAAYAEEVFPGRDGFSYGTVRNGLIAAIPSMPECLWVLDNRSEMLFIYYIEDSANTRLQLRYRESLANLFRRARG